MCSHLETARRAASTSTLELAALAADVRLDVASRGSGVAEVLDGLTSVLGAAQENRVRSLGGDQSKLVKGQALSTGGDNARTGGVSEAQGAHPELGGRDETRIVRDSSNQNGNLVLLASHVSGDTGNAHGRPVNAGHEQTLQNDTVERAGGTASQEPVDLDQQGKVHVARSRLRALLVADESASSF